MKNKLAIFGIAILLSACANDDAKHVDVVAEFEARPIAALSLADGTIVKGFEGDYCTASVCLNKDPVDFSSPDFTPIQNGSALYLEVSGGYEIESITASLLKKDGREFYRDLEFSPTLEDRKYVLEQVFESSETQVTLHVLVDFLEQGRSNFYYPIEL